MTELKDQIGRTVKLEAEARRIVSLVPSQTELLSHLHLNVVGITKFCVHPKTWFNSKTRVGGTKNPDIEKIRGLKPDLILANKEENRFDDIEVLSKEFPVYVSDVNHFDDAYRMMTDVGRMTGTVEDAEKLCDEIRASVKFFPVCSGRVLYFIWKDPLMVAGPSTFIGHVLERLGYINAVDDKTVRYIEITPSTLKNYRTDLLILSSEPFPFNETHQAELSGISNAKALLADGEIFSWYGPRMLKMASYFRTLQAV